MGGQVAVNWAIIPAAGLGTRMTENAVLGCKELIEVGGQSMLERTIQEVENAGIENIIVVSSPNKPAIDTALQNRGVKIVHQNEPKGLIDAVRCANNLVKGEPILIALPDVLYPEQNPTSALLEKYAGLTTLAIVKTELPWAKHLHDTGRVTKLEGDTLTGISRKNPSKPFPIGEYRITGRSIWNQDFWDVAENDEVLALQKLATKRKLQVCIVKTSYVDVGLPVGYDYAQMIFNQ